MRTKTTPAAPNSWPKWKGALNQAFDEISFEMGFNGEKYELILTPEGDKVKLFELVYFQKHAPKEVLEHWNILVGRQPLQNIGLRTEDGWDISGDDVQIWLEEQGENSFALSAYCEKLLPMLREAEGRVWWMLTTLTDQVLGEIPHMRYIDSFDVLEEPKAEPSMLMSQLPDALKERGLELSTDPEAYLESYLGYEMKPNEDPDADWRLDVMVGSTCCVPLINGYLNADNDFMDESPCRRRGGGLLLLSPGHPAGGGRIGEDLRLPGQAGRSVHHWRRPGDPHPHRRSHRPFLRLCGLHRLGHPGGAPDGQGVL